MQKDYTFTTPIALCFASGEIDPGNRNRGGCRPEWMLLLWRPGSAAPVKPLPGETRADSPLVMATCYRHGNLPP